MYNCHLTCASKVPRSHQRCPLPEGAINEDEPADGVTRGTGTALEGWVSLPRPEGVRKGWVKVWLVMSDAYLSFHAAQSHVVPGGLVEEKPAAESFMIIDLRYELMMS